MTPFLDSHYSVAVIGDWHLAFNTAACLSSVGHKTVLVNPLQGTDRWEDFPVLQLNEPGLAEMISSSRARGSLSYANGVSSEWSAGIAWLAIDTPVNDQDEADVTPLLKAIGDLRDRQGFQGLLVVSSQVPIGFCKQIEKNFKMTVAYVPENLRLGKGIDTFIRADRTVIGSDDPLTRSKVREFLKDFETEFLVCDLVTSEMIKHATNIFLATSISFSNELARVGETMGVDNQVVGQALKLDKRIGKGAYVSPGLGFAGGTLPRDLRIIRKKGADAGVPTPLVDAVLAVNESTSRALVGAVKAYLRGLRGRKILLVGYTYKAETNTLRRSPSLDAARELVREGAEVYGFDPLLNDGDLSPLKGWISHFDVWTAISFCPDAAMIMTPRPQFAELDWASLFKYFRRNPGDPRPIVLDARNGVPVDRVLDAGFAYKALWQPVQGGL